MKNIIFSKFISVLLIFIIILSLFPQLTHAQPSSSSLGEVKGFNKSILDNHFTRADREITAERWLEQARLGISQAINALELTADSLFEVEKWSNEELEKRFSKWLVGRFFGEASEKVMMDFLSMFGETQKNYTWNLDGDGNIIFDDKTGNPLIIRPGDENREFSRDILLWQDEAKSHINNALLRLTPELLAYVPADLRQSMSALIYETVSAKASSIKIDFENIAAREERIFISNRTRDIWSLRNQSENNSARLFTERLIAETENACNTGIAELNARIEQAQAGTGDLAILGEEWLQLYKDQFDRGLKAWEEAEERFFIRRIEWEQESYKLFSEGTEIWLEAFDQFEKERAKWELQAKDLFDTGIALFDKISEDFSKNIAEARKEFELNMAMRIGEGTARVKALVDMYLISSSAAISAMENTQFWYEQCEPFLSQTEKINPKDPGFSVWLNSAAALNNNIAVREMEKSYNMYLSYMEKAMDSRNRIYSDYAELFGTGALKDILSLDASSEDFFLDEYQIALIRSKALVLYWERKTAIAEAVINYANELSAGRITATEGVRAWENAKSAYNESLAVYESELNKLNKIGNDIQSQQVILNNIAFQLQAEEEKLNRLSQEYSLLVSSSAVGQEIYFTLEINLKYNNLVDAYSNLKKSGVHSSYYDSLLYAMLLENAEQNEIREQIQNILSANNNLLEEELINLNYEYYILNPDVQDEMWQETLNSLSALFNKYGIQKTQNILPDIQTISETLVNKSGDFIQNTAMFLLDFDSCIQFVPEWLENEINNWKNVLLEYIAIYTYYHDIQSAKTLIQLTTEENQLYNEYSILLNYILSDKVNDQEAENIKNILSEINIKLISSHYSIHIAQIHERLKTPSNNKNWRQHLTMEYLNNINPAIASASTWKEGIFQDIIFDAEYFTNRIADSFTLYSQRKLFNTGKDADFYFMLYSESSANSVFALNYYEALCKDFLNSAAAFFSVDSKKTATMSEVKTKEKELKNQETIYNNVKERYFTEAGRFMDIGALYDLQYSVHKTAFENSDKARFEYEKQDAIQRWAGTSYIDADNTDLENCRSKLSKAKTVLEVLSDLYNNSEGRINDNPEYNAVYLAYEQSFVKKLRALEAFESLISELTKEQIKNNSSYSQYHENLGYLGFIDSNYNNYISPDNKSNWNIKDIITVKDGRIVFSRDTSMVLSGVDASKADSLVKFFNSPASGYDNELYDINLYEESLRSLSERMSGYFTNKAKFDQWSLARDYLINQLIKNNGELEFLLNHYSGIGSMTANGVMGSLSVETGPLSGGKNLNSRLIIKESYYINYASKKKYNEMAAYNSIKPKDYEKKYLEAWNKLTSEEKADLEYYIILTFTENEEYLKGFSLVHTHEVYNDAYSFVSDMHSRAKKGLNNPLLFFLQWEYRDMRDINSKAMSNIKPSLDATKELVENWKTDLNQTLINIKNNLSVYQTSSQRIIALEGKCNESNHIVWNNIQLSLSAAGRINEEEIKNIKTLWESMQSGSSRTFNNVPDALSALYQWTKAEEETAKYKLNAYLTKETGKQQENEIKFNEAIESFIAGTINREALKTAADNTYGKASLSLKNHYDNLYNSTLTNLSQYRMSEFNFYDDYSLQGAVLVSSANEILTNRYSAEYAVREAQWSLMMKDLNDKKSEWLNSASLIMENGRTDWIKSTQKMNTAFDQWRINFQNEFDRVNEEWTIAYLAGLEDKEIWLNQAADAANKGVSEAFLSLVGAEGERSSRFMDIREPFGIRGAIPQAQALLSELLKSSGIVNMTGAFGALNNISGTITAQTSRGLGGVSIWNSAFDKSAASDMARKTNSEIADSESRRLAYNAALAADQAIKNLIADVDSANKNFRKNMDNFFIHNGLWSINGNNYVKEVVKGSTLIDSIISKTVTISGYADYLMEPVRLKTKIDTDYLASLNSIAIRGLIDNVYAETREIAAGIFGDNKESIPIQGERELSPGTFGAYIGYGPYNKEKMGSKRSDMFIDEGSGELGRLMTEFTYWAVIDSIGNTQVQAAPWDKRIWDDDGSWFKSPTVRTVGTIAASIAGAVFSSGTSLAGIAIAVGISSASEITFGVLDFTFGYKKLDEVGFNIGKSLLINTASGFIGFGLNGLSGSIVNSAVTPFGKVMAKTVMTGAQTFSTGIVTSAISGITYNSGGKWGYDKDIFISGINNAVISSLTSMTSTFTTTGLTAINSGLDFSKLTGFNKLNQDDIGKLNSLAGSLAGQGVNYALGNDFTLNILNMGLFSNDRYKSGLLELNLGRDGVTMNIGTEGANISIDNLLASFRGAQVWNVNNRISNYGKENDFDALVALRAQYGYGDSVHKDRLWDILNEKTVLNTKAEGDYNAETTLEGGKRVINLTGYKDGMSADEQFLLAIVLGHEAYRDGAVTSDNYLETRAATAAHTEMALRMLFGGETISYNENLMQDLSSYIGSKMTNNIDLFNSYVDTNYSSSADYWKLVLGEDSIARFIWDGEYTFDLSAIGIDGRRENLNDDVLSMIHNLGFTNITQNAIETFYNLNAAAKALETVLIASAAETSESNDNNNTTSDIAVRRQIASFYNTLNEVQNSGLLLRTDPSLVSSAGNHPIIFADGRGTITTNSGERSIFFRNKYRFEPHIAWDMVNENKKLVAPMSGSLDIDFTSSLGLNITTYGEKNQSVSYGHSGDLSIKDIIAVFSSTGVSYNNVTKALDGIAKNMVIGTMGNTGTYTTGAHVHLVYRVNNTALHPGLFFNENNNISANRYPSTFRANSMSGFNSNTLTATEIDGMLNYLLSVNKNRSEAIRQFFNYARANENYSGFTLALLRRQGIRP